MELYFDMRTILDLYSQDPGNAPDTLAEVYTHLSPEMDKDHVFILSSQPSLMEMTGHASSADILTDLIEHIPMYRINLEFLLDQILVEASHNEDFKLAVQNVFSDHTVLQRVKIEEDDLGVSGQSLQFPAIGHFDSHRLAKSYLDVSEFIGFDKRFSFSAVLHKHPGRFLERFDGYIFGQYGAVCAKQLLAFGLRHDTISAARQHENYIDAGRRMAEQEAFESNADLLKAYMRATKAQIIRCHDLDRALKLKDLPKAPAWIRHDVASVLKRESMKQVFAESLVGSSLFKDLQTRAPKLAADIQAHASGQVDEMLQRLLSETLNSTSHYAGAAAAYAQKAQERLERYQAL